jgi:beta-galactosidase
MTVAADTYLDTSALHKGMVWVNQHPLGRFWSIGPQHALFLPAPWLRRGPNEIVFFDSMSVSGELIKSTDKPIFDTTSHHD